MSAEPVSETESRRLKASESRDALVQSGRELWEENSATADPVGVDFMDAVDRSGVARSTAYRLFTDGSGSAQHNYQHALLSHLVKEAEDVEYEATSGPIEELMASVAGDIESLDSTQLAHLTAQLIRLSVESEMDSLARTPNFWLGIAANAATGASNGNSEAATEIRTTLRDAAIPEQYVEMYRQLTSAIGARLRPGWTWERFYTAMNAAIIGCALRTELHPELMTMERPTGPDGAEETWQVAATIAQGIALVALEPHPRMRAPVDLMNWLHD